MVFWIFMLLMNLLLPVLMIVFGKLFMISSPGEINNYYGYRTARSKRSQEAWEFAQQYFGRVWWKAGWILLPVIAVLMLPVLGRGNSVVGIWGGIEAMLGCAAMVLTILPVERELKRRFDENGKRIEGARNPGNK